MGLAPSSVPQTPRPAAFARCLSQFFNTLIEPTDKIHQEFSQSSKASEASSRPVARGAKGTPSTRIDPPSVGQSVSAAAPRALVPPAAGGGRR